MRIDSIGVHVPSQRIANEEFLDRFGLTPEFLREKLGILERSIKRPDQTTSDLCVLAFEDLAATTAVLRPEIDVLCVVTQNPDYKIPHTAAIVHQRLGMDAGCMTFDISQGCAGYVHGIAIASGLIETLGLRRALVFTCDPYSKIINTDDRDTALLFGDAATVTLLSRGGGGYRLVDADFGTAPGSHSVLMCEEHFKMDGRGVFLHAARAVPASVRKLLQRNGLSIDDVDAFLLHPGSKNLIDVIRRELRLDESKLPFEATEYGNTVSSSIPLMLRSRLKDRRFSRLLLSGFGVGFSWGSCLIETTKSGEIHDQV